MVVPLRALRFSAMLAAAFGLLVMMPHDVAAKHCECKDIDDMTTELERVSKAEPVWKEIFAWVRGLHYDLPKPSSNDELNTKYALLMRAPRADWDRIMHEPIQKIEILAKAGWLDEHGEPIVNADYEQAHCDDIVESVRVHERAHRSFYLSLGNFLEGGLMSSRHLRLRVESEVVSNRTHKEFLKEKLETLESKCKRFKVNQIFGAPGGRLSGVICSELDEPFSLTFENDSAGLVGVLTFTPSGNGRGTYSYSGYLKSGGVTNEGVGNFRIEGVEKGTPVIQMDAGEWSQTTAGFGTISTFGRPETILLEPVTNECK